MKLREIAYSRSGDKGDISNVCVFVYDDAQWEFLLAELTVERVKEKYRHVVHGAVERYVFPNMKGLNFVMHEALGGGSALSLRVDTHGKSMQSLMLDIELPGDADRGA
jgi:hypothetical protein